MRYYDYQDHQPKAPSVRYAEEDLAPRDPGAEDAFVDAFVERNKRALNTSIKESLDQFEHGEYFTHAQVFADLEAQALRRDASRF